MSQTQTCQSREGKGQKVYDPNSSPTFKGKLEIMLEPVYTQTIHIFE